MPVGANDRRSETRYDCFLSFPGSQALSSLKFPWARPGDDVRGLAREVYERLCGFHRSPSVFFDHGELKGGRYRDDISKAVLQLRGGGVALILLTAEYLRRKWCLAELHAFLQLHKLGKTASRSSEAVVIRVVCLDSIHDIKSALRGSAIRDFVGDVGSFQWQFLQQGPESTRALVLNQICRHVLDYWSVDDGTSVCLGRHLNASVYYLRDFFPTTSGSASQISAAFGVRVHEGTTRDFAFDQALQQGKFSHHYLDALARATTDVDAKQALIKFRRKWVSDGWEWSIEQEENDICLSRFIDDAARALALGNDTNVSRVENAPAAPVHPIYPLAPTTVSQTVDRFRPHLEDRQRMCVDLDVSVATSLAQLKAAILPADSGLWAFLGSIMARVNFFRGEPDSSSPLRPVALTSLCGEGGVGKTSTCHLICADRDVRKHFSNGAIVWIDVGKDATAEKVKDELGRIVSDCGGERNAEIIRAAHTIGQAVGIALSFFSKRRILVVVDNVWETPDNVWETPGKKRLVNWAAALSKMATFPGSAVIMTTRFAPLSRIPGFVPVRLGRLDLESSESPDWQIAENLFDTLLKASPSEKSTDSYKKNRRKALQISCGLPIGIKTFACVVERRMQVGDDVQSVLEKIERRALAVGLADKFVGEKLEGVVGHPGLFAAMKENLEFLDKHEGPRVVHQMSTRQAERKDANGNDVRLFRANYDDLADLSLSSRYSALSMAPVSSIRLSFPVLCRLWHLRNVDEAEEIAQLFVDVGLGRVEGIGLGQERVFCLHDLQYSYCVDMRDVSASSAIGVKVPGIACVNGHALFLSSCESLLVSAESHEIEADDVGTGWAMFCFGKVLGLSEPGLRQDVSQNLVRHLCGAAAVMDADGVRRTFRDILSDFRWLRGRIAVDGHASVVADCTTALAARSSTDASSRSEARLLTGDSEKSIRALQQSLMLVGEGVSVESDGSLAGSLLQLAQSFVGTNGADLDDVFFDKLITSTESEVRGSWFKPVHGCSRARDQDLLAQRVVGNESRVWSLAALGDGTLFVSGSADGVVRVHEPKFLHAVLELNGHDDKVFCVAVAKAKGVESSFLIFSGSFDGTVRSWEVGVDLEKCVIEKASVIVHNCESPVLCLAVSNGGDLVAAGCQNGYVYISKRQGGSSALKRNRSGNRILFEVVINFRCRAIGQNMDGVRGVAVFGSGDFVVAAEKKGGIAFWCIGGGIEGTVDRYCASAGRDVDLREALLSEDESSVTFVFSKPEGYEVWDAASRRRIRPPVSLSSFEALTCAAISDGMKACVGGSRSRGALIAGGFDENGGNFVNLYSTSDEFKVLSKYLLTSTPRSVCCASFDGAMRILVGSDDGCVRMLDAGVKLKGEGGRSLKNGVSDESCVTELNFVEAVAVMPIAGFALAGHKDGRFSLWGMESGEVCRSFSDSRGNWVRCVVISADECLAVSGHVNGITLVWDASTWECRFALGGHSDGLVCAAISADAKQIVTVDFSGEIRLWDAESNGVALLTIQTGIEFSIFGSRGAISLDGRIFLWASRDDAHDQDHGIVCREDHSRPTKKWRGKVVDLRDGSIVLQSEETDTPDWDAFLEEITSREVLKGALACAEVQWGFGAVCLNRLVELPDVESGRHVVDRWRISSGDECGVYLPRIDCALRIADGGAIPAAASLGFDSNIWSIAAGWIPGEVDAGRRRIAVVCALRARSFPSIMHFFPVDG